MSQYGRDQLAESGCREGEGLQQERWGGMKEDRERATGGGGGGGDGRRAGGLGSSRGDFSL